METEGGKGFAKDLVSEAGWFDLHVLAPQHLHGVHDFNVHLVVCFVINMLQLFFTGTVVLPYLRFQ